MKRDLQRCADIYSQDAKLVGLEYLGGSEKATRYRKYRQISCQHELDLIPANVRRNQFTCKICQHEKFLKEAENGGLVLLNRVTRHKFNYRLPCDHEQEIHLSAVRTNEWICRTCNQSYFDLPSNLYLLKIKSANFEWLKFGYSRNLTVRTRSYKLISSEIELILLQRVVSGRLAIKIEQEIHSEFFNDRLDPSLMMNYHTQDGYTECYPVSMLTQLTDAILTKLSRAV